MFARQGLYSNRELAGELRSRHAALTEQCQTARDAIEEELRVALLGLAALYLPQLDPESLQRCAELSGFRGFERRDPIAAREHERKVLESTVRTREADPRFVNRDRLVGDRGELTTALTGAREALATAQAPCDRFELQETFLELIANFYDTPQFTIPWYRADYWRMWAAGDRICRALGLDDFGDDVLPAYRRVAEPRDLYRGEVMRLESEVNGVHAIVKERDDALARLQQLDQLYLDQSWGYLAEHLGFADLGLLHEWASRAEPAWTAAIHGGLRRVAGVRAKVGYVDEIVHGTGELQEQLDARISKYNRKIAKLDRGKYVSDDEVRADSLPLKADAMRAQADKTQQRLDRLVAARNYDDFDPMWERERWWWHLTQSPPTRLCGHTRSWYDAHPDVMTVADDAPADDGVARAFVAGRESETTGYLS